LESLSTLKFAHRAKHIQNEARVNEDLDEKALLRRYERELKKLRSELQAKSKNVVDKRKLIEVEEQRRRAEADRSAALATLELLSKDLLKEKSSKKALEERIKEMNSQLLVGGITGGGGGNGSGSPGGAGGIAPGAQGANGETDPSSPTFASHHAFQLALQQEQDRIRAAYASKLAELESERQGMEEEKAQTSRYKALLLKQRDIMIQLTARLNERDQSILLLQEELDGYDRHQRAMEDELDAKRHRLIQLQRMNAAGGGGGGGADEAGFGGAEANPPASPTNSGANLYGLFPIDEAPYFEDNALSPVGSPSAAAAGATRRDRDSGDGASSSPSASSPTLGAQAPVIDPMLLEQEVQRRVAQELARAGGGGGGPRDDAMKARMDALQDALERKSSESLRLREELERVQGGRGGGGDVAALQQGLQERDAQMAALQAQNVQLAQSVTALQMMLQSEKAQRASGAASNGSATSPDETRMLRESLSSLRRKHDVQLQERAALRVILEKKMKALIDSIANAALHGVVPRSSSSASPGPDGAASSDAAVKDALPARTKREIEVLQRLVEASLTALKNADSSAAAADASPPLPSPSASPAPSMPQRSPSPANLLQQADNGSSGSGYQRLPSSSPPPSSYSALPLSSSAPRSSASGQSYPPPAASSSSYRSASSSSRDPTPPTASISLASSTSASGVDMASISARLQARKDELQRLDERGAARER